MYFNQMIPLSLLRGASSGARDSTILERQATFKMVLSLAAEGCLHDPEGLVSYIKGPLDVPFRVGSREKPVVVRVEEHTSLRTL